MMIINQHHDVSFTFADRNSHFDIFVLYCLLSCYPNRILLFDPIYVCNNNKIHASFFPLRFLIKMRTKFRMKSVTTI